MARLEVGHSTKITFANYPSVELQEKEITPPSVSAGGEIDTTTMHNTAWRTKAPKVLKTLGEASGSYTYAVAAYTDLMNMVGENQLITVTFPDASTVAFWGWVDEFTPQRVTEGDQPMADVKIIPSMRNSSGAETAPVIG